MAIQSFLSDVARGCPCLVYPLPCAFSCGWFVEEAQPAQSERRGTAAAECTTGAALAAVRLAAVLAVRKNRYLMDDVRDGVVGINEAVAEYTTAASLAARKDGSLTE